MTLPRAKHFYTYKYLKSLGLLEIFWNGVISASDLQVALQDIAALLEEEKITYLLSDARFSKAAKATDESWVRTFCMPLLANTSIKRFARIACPTAIPQHLLTGIIDTIDQERQYKFEMKTFREREAAMDWLFAAETLKEQMPYRGDCRAFSLI